MGQKYLEAQVGHDRFRQHFAVLETEAWLLCDPTLVPEGVPKKSPEQINDDALQASEGAVRHVQEEDRAESALQSRSRSRLRKVPTPEATP